MKAKTDDAIDTASATAVDDKKRFVAMAAEATESEETGITNKSSTTLVTEDGGDAGMKKKSMNHKKSKGGKSRKDAILSKMMERLSERGSSLMTFPKTVKAILGNNATEDRPLNKWKEAWKTLIEEGDIEPTHRPSSFDDHDDVRDRETEGEMFAEDAEFQLTSKSVDRIAPEEYKESQKMLSEDAPPVKSIQEYHDRIRKLCQNKRGEQIFDTLLKYGSLHKKELAATIGIQAKGPSFFYPLQKLVQWGYVEYTAVSKKHKQKVLRLTDKAFLHPETERPEPIELDANELAAAMEKVYGGSSKKRKAITTDGYESAIVEKRESAFANNRKNLKMETEDHEIDNMQENSVNVEMPPNM